jgi:hypothetical protein
MPKAKEIGEFECDEPVLLTIVADWSLPITSSLTILH